MTDQIADKVCATLSLYKGKPSSREKDLVDLVLMATTQQILGARLERALTRGPQLEGLIFPSSSPCPEDGDRLTRISRRAFLRVEITWRSERHRSWCVDSLTQLWLVR